MSTAVLLMLAMIFQSTGARALPIGGLGNEPVGIKRLLENQLAAREEMRARDVYKLLYQAAFGVEHLLTDTAGVRTSLLEELGGLDTMGSGEPLLERISPNGEMVRVNLIPFKTLNLQPELLVQAMFRSAAETVPDTLLFYRYWNETTALVRYRLIPWNPPDLDEWDARVRGGDLRPARHSGEYRDANRPSYRVVRRNIIEEILGRSQTP